MEEGRRAERVRRRLRTQVVGQIALLPRENGAKFCTESCQSFWFCGRHLQPKPACARRFRRRFAFTRPKKRIASEIAHAPPAVAARAVASQRPVPPHPSPRAAGTTPPPAEALPPSTRVAPSPPAHAAARSCLVQQQRSVLTCRPEIIVAGYRVGASHCARVPRRIPPEVQTRASLCRPLKRISAAETKTSGHKYRRCCGCPRRGCGS